MHRVAERLSAPIHPRRRGRAWEDDRGRPDHPRAARPRRRDADPHPRAVGPRRPVAAGAQDEVQPGLLALQQRLDQVAAEQASRREPWTLEDSVITSTAMRRGPERQKRNRRCGLGHGRHRRGASRPPHVPGPEQDRPRPGCTASRSNSPTRSSHARQSMLLLTATPMQLASVRALLAHRAARSGAVPDLRPTSTSIATSFAALTRPSSACSDGRRFVRLSASEVLVGDRGMARTMTAPSSRSALDERPAGTGRASCEASTGCRG